VSDENLDSAAPGTQDQPINDAADPGAPDQSQQSSGEESFTDFDPSEIPEAGVSPQWLKERYGQMQGDYTKKTQEIAETRRAKEELEGIVTALREGDPQTRRTTLSKLGVDQQAALEAFELEMAEAQEPQDQAQGDEFDLDFKDPRVDSLLQEREAEKAERAELAQQAEAEQYADEVGGKMEEDLKVAFGGKEPDEAVAEWIFSRAIEHPNQQGDPDVPGAVKAWNEVLDKQRQEWLDSRQGPRATTPGIPGTERFDMSTDEGRVAAGAIAAREARSAAR
jgi:hypothetical protein